MFLRRSSLGEVVEGETFFDRLLRVPVIERGIIDPIYRTGEAKAWTSIKEGIGPWVIGVGVGLLFVNLYLAREVGRRRT